MKKYIRLFISACFLLLIGATGCEKKIEKVMLTGGTKPVLSASIANTIPLSFANRNMEAIKLSWTNPNYRFSTGPSSQDVNYSLEVDTTGANFTNPKRQTFSISRDVSRMFTQGEFNAFLIDKLELTIGTPHNIEIRIKSSLGSTNAAMLISNVLKFSVTPYQDPTLLPPDLYITGNATPSDWTNSPPTTQKFTYLGSKKYEITMAFVPGRQYKFLTKPGSWTPQYGSASSSGGTLGVNDGTTSDPPAIDTPGVSGNYKITVDLGSLTYAIVKL